MADMTLKWEAHDKNVVAELEKMNKAMEQLKETNRKLSEEGKKHHEETHSWMHEQVHAIGEMAAGYVTIEKAIDVVSDGYREWMALLDEAGKKHRDFTQDVMRQLTMAGDAAHADTIKHWAEHGPGTKEQMMAAFSGVTSSMPEASLEQRQALASQVAIQAGTGIDMQAAGAGAGTIGRFAPGKSADDVQDINTLLMQKLRGGQGKLADDSFMRGVGALVDSGGMDLEQALGMGGLAVSKNQKLGFMNKLGELATASSEELTKDIKPGEAPTAEQALKSQLAGMTAKQRIDAVLGDQRMAEAGLGGEAAFQLGRMPQGEIARWRGMLLDAQANNIGSRIEGGETGVGREAAAEHDVALREQETEGKLGPAQARLARVHRAIETDAAKRGMGDWLVAKTQRGLDALMRGIGAESAEHQAEGLARAHFSPEEANRLLAESLDRHTEALKENTRAQGGVNVDAHGE